MDFLGIGFGEIIVILVLALIVMGPGKLAETARTLGKTLRAVKKASSNFNAAINRELDITQESSFFPPDKDQPATSKPPATDNPQNKARRNYSDKR
jgi:sec-independent protein translocase protein TatA